MLVFKVRHDNEYMTFALTTGKPRYPSDFLKGADGEPRLLQKGLRRPSYLQLMPVQNVVDNGDCKRVTRFPPNLFEQAVNEFAQMIRGDTR
jgi:hypothetical protein